MFLFGETHSSFEIKRLNVLDALKLVDAVAVGFVGTETRMLLIERLDENGVRARSAELLAAGRTAEGAIEYLYRHEHGGVTTEFRFGDTLKLFRPALNVCCVEDHGLMQRTNGILLECKTQWLIDDSFDADAAFNRDPIHKERESAMVQNLFANWLSSSSVAIFNTGSMHCRPIAEALQAQDSSTCIVRNV